ncbi:MAG TPA: hypothetical protein VMP68_00960 [Candidatus Eisenbacteria bacterium]|nr:hypothetical protein [Candidatus Eisenbacteria bacterium]
MKRMRTKRTVWPSSAVLVPAAVLLILGGCGGSNNLTLQNPAAPPSTPVSIAFKPAPAKSISLATTAALTAVVDDDPANLGVDWSLLCPPNAACGTLNTLHTPSGTAVTYTPPPTISGNSQTFTIQAFAAADNTKNVVANIAVTGFASALKGTYVFSSKGIDANGDYQLAGVVALDGNGKIISGEQTVSDPLFSVSDAITGGSYYIGPDGRGSLTINTTDQNIGQGGIENFSLVVVSNARGLIGNLDDPTLSTLSYETSSGSLELQTSKPALTGGYAFVVSGTGSFSGTPSPTAFGGILNVDSPGSISGTGSVADEFDGYNGVVNSNAIVSGTVTSPDSFGSVKFNLTASFAPTPILLTGYIVDAQHIRLVETDVAAAAAGFASTSGLAISQGSVTGTFTANQAFAGSYVFGILGQDFGGLPTSMASAGTLTADANGNLSSGFADEFVLGAGKNISDSLSGTYTLDPSGTGRVDTQVGFTRHEPAPELIFYLTGNGNPPVVLSVDTTLGALGIGVANPQTTSKISFNGKYGMRFTQGVASNGVENDSTAQFTATATKGTFVGIVDSDVDFNGQPNSPLSGTFAPGSAVGLFSGIMTDPFFPTIATAENTLSMDYFLVDSTQGYFIETDSLVSTDLTFGYFAARTPVCASCQ